MAGWLSVELQNLGDLLGGASLFNSLINSANCHSQELLHFVWRVGDLKISTFVKVLNASV